MDVLGSQNELNYLHFKDVPYSMVLLNRKTAKIDGNDKMTLRLCLEDCFQWNTRLVCSYYVEQFGKISIKMGLEVELNTIIAIT